MRLFGKLVGFVIKFLLFESQWGVGRCYLLYYRDCVLGPSSMCFLVPSLGVEIAEQYFEIIRKIEKFVIFFFSWGVLSTTHFVEKRCFDAKHTQSLGYRFGVITFAFKSLSTMKGTQNSRLFDSFLLLNIVCHLTSVVSQRLQFVSWISCTCWPVEVGFCQYQICLVIYHSQIQESSHSFVCAVVSVVSIWFYGTFIPISVHVVWFFDCYRPIVPNPHSGEPDQLL